MKTERTPRTKWCM